MKEALFKLLRSLKDKKVQGVILAYIPAVLAAFGINLMPEQMELVENIVIAVSSLLGLIGIMYSPKKEDK